MRFDSLLEEQKTGSLGGGVDHSRFIRELESVFYKGMPNQSMSVHSNRPDTCSVCIKPYAKNGSVNHEAQWDDLGLVRCPNCGHIAIKGHLKMHNANKLLSKIGYDSWEKWLSGKSSAQSASV